MKQIYTGEIINKGEEEVSTKIKEVETTDEETQAQMLSYENDILSGLMAAANFRENEDEFVVIDIERAGVKYLSFRIHPLSEDEYNECRKKNTKFVRSKSLGVKVPDETDASRFRSCLIYAATVDEDRKKIWDNKQAWDKLNALNAPDLISKVLKAGEKDRICEKIDEISGYSEAELETIKN